jgi:hypothetical protein
MGYMRCVYMVVRCRRASAHMRRVAAAVMAVSHVRMYAGSFDVTYHILREVGVYGMSACKPGCSLHWSTCGQMCQLSLSRDAARKSYGARQS